MGFPDFLLIPFKKFFVPPTINTPMSTIKVPPPLICTSIVFVSFIIIVGGVIFCQVRGMPFAGPVRGKDGNIYLSWMDTSSSSNQFGAEGIIAASIFSFAALTFLSAQYTLNHDPSKVSTIISMLAKVTPFTCIASLLIFQAKASWFRPAFVAR